MKCYPKLNIFLKIIAKDENYHKILSRFVIFEEIYDEIEIIDKISDELILNDKIQNNIIKLAYKKLCDYGFYGELDEFFRIKQIKLTKNIPQGGGLGGGSSDAGNFLLLMNNELNLKISKPDLLKIAQEIGSDVSFFVSGFKSANVSGRGEIVEAFDDEIPKLKGIFSQIFCSTPKVFQEYRLNFYNPDPNLAKKLSLMKSSEILNEFSNYELNDLARACEKLYPELNLQKDEFLSGSGSTKFAKQE